MSVRTHHSPDSPSHTPRQQNMKKVSKNVRFWDLGERNLPRQILTEENGGRKTHRTIQTARKLNYTAYSRAMASSARFPRPRLQTLSLVGLEWLMGRLAIRLCSLLVGNSPFPKGPAEIMKSLVVFLSLSFFFYHFLYLCPSFNA